MPTLYSTVLLHMHACCRRCSFIIQSTANVEAVCLVICIASAASTLDAALTLQQHLHTCTDAPGVTPDPLDHSFAWQLLSVLQGIDAVALENDNGCSLSQVNFLQRLVVNQQPQTTPAYCISCQTLWNSFEHHSMHDFELPFSAAYTFCTSNLSALELHSAYSI